MATVMPRKSTERKFIRCGPRAAFLYLSASSSYHIAATLRLLVFMALPHGHSGWSAGAHLATCVRIPAVECAESVLLATNSSYLLLHHTVRFAVRAAAVARRTFKSTEALSLAVLQHRQSSHPKAAQAPAIHRRASGYV